MAVEINVEVEETPELDLELEILQFVGIADHNQLKNRDLENQHPIGAIEGLNEKLKGLDKEIETTKEVVTEHGESILGHDKLLEEHGTSLEELIKFKSNIATAETVKEVLQNG